MPSGTSEVLTPEPDSELAQPNPRTVRGRSGGAAAGAAAGAVVVGGVARGGGGLKVVGAGAKLGVGAGSVVGGVTDGGKVVVGEITVAARGGNAVVPATGSGRPGK